MKNALSNPMLPALCEVKKIIRDTHDVFTMELNLGKSGHTHTFKSGQFNMLYAFGVGEIPVSISSDPDKPESLLHTIRSVGSVSKALNSVKKGNQIGVRGPFGNFWPIDQYKGSDIVIIAGGIGLAPLRSAIYKILSKREDYGKLILLYGSRSPEEIIYRQELERWSLGFDFKIQVTVDLALGNWHGHIGVVTNLISLASFTPEKTVAMICGPEVMMRYSILELIKRGVDTDNIFISMERNMKCAVGFCGRCQFGPDFICKDGPVFKYSRVKELLSVWEI